MRATLDAGALVLVVAGVLGFVVTARRGLAEAVRLAVEFWLAAGLLRLAHDPDWERITTAAALLVVRAALELGRGWSSEVSPSTPARRRRELPDGPGS